MGKVKTKKEALKGNLITFIGMEVLGTVGLVLGLLFEDIMILGLIFAITFVLGGVYVYLDGKKAINRSYCLDCKTKYDFNKDINWEEVERVEKNDRVISKVEFECTCPKCGVIQEFSQNFTVSHYDKKKGEWRENNLYTMARKYFVK